MTPSEAKNLIMAIPMEMATDTESKKVCLGVVKKGSLHQKCSKRVVGASSTVQALSLKFDKMSSEAHQTDARSKKNVRNCKQNSGKVVIRRKSSACKFRKRTPVRKSLNDNFQNRAINLDQIDRNQTNVLKKIIHFEEKKESFGHSASNQLLKFSKIFTDDEKCLRGFRASNRFGVKPTIEKFEKNCDEREQNCVKEEEMEPTSSNDVECEKSEEKSEGEVKKGDDDSRLFEKISRSNVGKTGKAADSKQRRFADLLNSSSRSSSSVQAVAEEQNVKSVFPILKPNASFLWSKKEEHWEHSLDKKMPIDRIGMPLPLPPRHFVPLLEKDEQVYDDVRGCGEKADDSDRNSIRSDDGSVYDDVGIPGGDLHENYEEIYKASESNKQKSNERSPTVEKKSEDSYCKMSYAYDDGVGEGYQYITRDSPETVKVVSENDSSKLYQLIEGNADDYNIYEDIQSVKSRLMVNDKRQTFFEEMSCVRYEGNGRHESVYEENRDYQSYITSNVSDVSSISGKSVYEKNNSLYGMSTVKDSGENADCDYFVRDGSVSENPFEKSGSDEWIEVTDSESEETIHKIKEVRKTKSKGWPRKVRRRWSKLQRRSQNVIGELKNEESSVEISDNHLYERITLDKNGEGKKTAQNDEAFTSGEQIYNEDQCIDDFDSQNSDNESNVEAPDTSNNPYNITKSLKAAGKVLKKNLSLKTSDLSRSLKKFKKQSRPKLDETGFTDNSKIVNNTSQNTQIYSSNSVADSSSNNAHNFIKSDSDSDVKYFKRRKTWTFRNKLKRNLTTDFGIKQLENDHKSSTFYFSLNEVHGLEKDSEKDVCLNRSSLDDVSQLRRKSQIAKMRPSIPPPPPPSNTKYSEVVATNNNSESNINVKNDKKVAESSCARNGLFSQEKKWSDFNTSWYAESGLYSSHSKISQLFLDEPLYQFYTECVNQQARENIINNYDSEGYEEINNYYTIINEKRRTLDIKNVGPNFEDFDEEVHSKAHSFRSQNRTLWCQVPVVINSYLLETMTDQQKKLQEAKFEILTSEGSYMNSLNILENHFMKKIKESNAISKWDYKTLFSNILAVKECSEKFLNDLEICWQDNILLNGICSIIYKHSTNNFSVYVKYCKNQACIYRTLRDLLDKNSHFENVIREIESDPICQNLSIHSFLMLPMQRITRLPLLLGAVLARLEKSDDEYKICEDTFKLLNKIVQECDDEAKKMEKCEEMLILSQQLEFPKEIRSIPIITGSRFLVKRGQVTQLVNRDENILTFGKKFSKITLHLFLFTDLLIVAKKKSVRSYAVVDHCPRNLVQLQTVEGLNQLPVKFTSSSDSSSKFLTLLTILENHERKTVEMMLSFEMESDRQRWSEAVSPKQSENPEESIYEEWDCPQVIAIYEFNSAQPDELSLCIGDVVNVLKKMTDGWFQGERLRDGAKGWFPENHTREISSAHVRAKNKKQRYRLLALSGNYIESQMKNNKQ